MTIAAHGADAKVQRVRMERLARTLRRNKTSKLALFLGAGASRLFGYPITRELMLEILKRLSSRKASKRARTGIASRRALRDFLERLLAADSDAAHRVPLVTSVLSLLDHSLATGQVLLQEGSLDETRSVRQALELELIDTIPDHAAFDEDEGNLFDIYSAWLSKLYRACGDLGVITSNYDMLSDLAACYVTRAKGKLGNWEYADVARKIDFGFRWNDPYANRSYPRPGRAKFSLYKLHGSTNWLRCPLCENVYINPDGPIAHLVRSRATWRGNVCDCSDTRLVAQIVSPSFVRSMSDPNLIAVWRNALDLLRGADHWLIIGYGFPDEDLGIRALFTRAFAARDLDDRPMVSVVQPDDCARRNYEAFFPENRLDYYTGGLELLLECSRA